MAVTIAQTAVQTCSQQGYRVSVHVIGNMGEVLVAMRGDNTGPHTMENSMRKALASRGQRIPSGQFAENVSIRRGDPIYPFWFLSRSAAYYGLRVLFRAGLLKPRFYSRLYAVASVR